MPINADKPHLWKSDVERSIDFYNDWFIRFAPDTAEFLYVNYGRVIRDYLTTRVTLLSIHQFDPDEVQFDDALVSSCIVTYRKAVPSRESVCEMSYGGDYLDPLTRKSILLTQLRGLNKWTMPHFEQGVSGAEDVRVKDDSRIS